MKPAPVELARTLTLTEYFTFGFGTMVGVGWVVLMDDWLARGGPGGAALGFLLGGLLLLPVAATYGRMVREVPDAGAEIAYAEGVFPPAVSFAAAWTMVLAYAIVCPWEAVAVGNLLARVFPVFNEFPLYEVAGKTITLPRLAVGLLLTAAIAWVNFRGIRPSAAFQKAMTFALLGIFAVFTALGFANGSASNLPPLFAQAGTGGAFLSILLVLQIVPYFMTGFESVGKESEEARPGFDPRGFGRAILAAAVIGCLFYVTVILAVSYVFPWKTLVAERLGTEAAFERAFSSRTISRWILFAAFLSLIKIFNGNFVAATRLLFGIGRRGLVHPALGRVHASHGTPSRAVVLMAVLTAAASFLGDAILVPVSEVGSLAVGVGWLSTCLADRARARRAVAGSTGGAGILAWAGAAVSAAVIAMKALPWVAGSFSRAEWGAFAAWSALGLAFWLSRPARPASA
ncbi:MAG TPA: APC family permease [Thermoanaerobaculia bacterium]